MSDVTTGEMVAWCDARLLQLASRMDHIKAHGGPVDDIEVTQDHIRILGAIKERLLLSAGKIEPREDYEPAPDNVVQGNFSKDDRA